MNVLVLAAHPDDETIGAGGAIALLAAAGARVTLWIATEVYEPLWPADERTSRRAEAEKAAAVLGIADLRFGGMPTMNLNTMPAIDIASAVSRVVDDVKPTLLLSPPPHDINADHSVIFDAALVAARGLAANPVRAFYAYEISTTSRFAAPGSAFQANTYVDITSTFDTKMSAFAAYRSERRDFPHPRSPEGLEILAAERGLACGARYAEAFLLISRRYAAQETPLL